MATYTVTIDVADFVANGVAPRLAYVTFSRLTVDATTGEIITTASTSVRVTQTPVTISLTSGVTYKVRGDGIAGVGTFYASASSDLSLAALKASHQVDPTTQLPVDQVVTVGAAIAAAQAAAIAAAAADATAKDTAAAASNSATYVALRGAWAAGTAYPKNSLVIQAGGVYLAAADVPSRTVFTAGDWVALGGTGTPAADLALTLAGAGVGSLTGTGLTATGKGVGSVSSTLLTSIGGGVGRIAA